MSAIIDKFFLNRNDAVLLVVDVQERLCRVMDEAGLEKLTENIVILQEAARELGVPIVVTEQYVKGLGETIPALKEKYAGPAIEKVAFGCCGEAAFPARLKAFGRRQVIVTGMESHVCVLQTVLGLLDEGYHVHLVKDAVLSRREENRQVGIEVSVAAGAVPTSTEAVLFQLLRVAGSDEFRKLAKLVR